MGNIIAGERYTGRFATTNFSTTQRCNIVATLIQMVATWFQHCNDVWRCTRGSGLFTKDKRLRCLTSPKTAHDSRKSFGIAHNNLAFYHSGKEMHLLPD